MGVLTVDHGSCPHMYLVSVLFISSIPHLTLHPLNIFVLVYCIFTLARVGGGYST